MPFTPGSAGMILMPQHLALPDLLLFVVIVVSSPIEMYLVENAL